MEPCQEFRLAFADLLRGHIAPRDRTALEEHLRECRACAQELAAIRGVWQRLPASADMEPPAGARAWVMDYAHRPARDASPVLEGIWEAVRGFVTPVTVGAAATLLAVAAMHVRGAMAPLSHLEIVTASVFLAAALAGAVGGLMRSGAPRPARALLSAALGSLGGYTLLTLASPIPRTVEFCRIALFRDALMSISELCLAYLVIATLYAGVPVGIAAYMRRAAGTNWWRAGVLEGAIFTLLAAPILVLQAGLDQWMISATVLTGLIVGAMGGGLAGNGVRAWRSGRSGPALAAS